jgi:DNA polymerase-3 subunit epsilon
MPKREVCLDTETTGLDYNKDRVIEIAAIELIDLVPSGKKFHVLINPEMPVPQEATAIHGLTDEKLYGKPIFSEIAQEFLDFIRDDTIIAHNAPFDVRMLDAEFQRIGLPGLSNPVIDTLRLSKSKFGANSRGSLDALCQRFGIDLSRRVKHEAMLDTELLAEVYFNLRGGKFRSLDFERNEQETLNNENPLKPFVPDRGIGGANETEIQSHLLFLEKHMKGKHFWSY